MYHFRKTTALHEKSMQIGLILENIFFWWNCNNTGSCDNKIQKAMNTILSLRLHTRERVPECLVRFERGSVSSISCCRSVALIGEITNLGWESRSCKCWSWVSRWVLWWLSGYHQQLRLRMSIMTPWSRVTDGARWVSVPSRFVSQRWHRNADRTSENCSVGTKLLARLTRVMCSGRSDGD